MDVLSLKIAAYITMLIDHAGIVFFSSAAIFRIIGRTAFPIFAFLASEGAKKSSNVWRYLLRLLLCGIISEIPFDLMLSGSVLEFGYQNICFTLFFGVLACAIYARITAYKTWYIKFSGGLASLVPVFLAGVLATDYGAAGAALVLLFYVARGSKPLQVFVLLFINTWMCLPEVGFDLVYVVTRVQMYGLLALPFILLYNGEKRVRAKTVWGRYGFYLFYPLHMVVIWAVGVLA